MPVTRAEELDARPADNAKELLALRDWMREPDHAAEFRLQDLLEWIDRRPIALVDRLSARQQASVEEDGGRAVIAGDAVVIRFPLDAFQSAMDGAWALCELDTRYKITSIDEFAQEFVRVLNREDERGTTAIHKMADRAFVNCIENGAFGIEEHEQQDI
jgi:hypothetical protein